MGALSKPLFAKCCIIGLGLMGASVGLALGKYRVVEERWGYDLNPGVMAEARARGAVDKTAGLEQALREAELVILAAPVGEIIKTLREIPSFVSRGALVTDVGSTKKEIVAALEKFLPPGVTGIGGHPMTGSEKSGIAAADPLILEKAAYLLTPTRQTPPPALEKLKQTVRAMEAVPFILEPEAHDRFAALVSHLPYLVTVALVQTLQSSGYPREFLINLTGNGFKDTTRIAMGEAAMWYDIFRTNKIFIGEALKNFQRELHLLQSNVEQENQTVVSKMLEDAARCRRSLDAREKAR